MGRRKRGKTSANPGVEIIEDGCYLRTVEIDVMLGSISAAHLPREKSLKLGPSHRKSSGVC